MLAESHSEFSEWIHIWFYDCHLLANSGVNQDIPLGSCNQEKRNLPENVTLGFIWIQKQCQRIVIFSQNAIFKSCRWTYISLQFVYGPRLYIEILSGPSGAYLVEILSYLLYSEHWLIIFSF